MQFNLISDIRYTISSEFDEECRDISKYLWNDQIFTNLTFIPIGAVSFCAGDRADKSVLPVTREH